MTTKLILNCFILLTICCSSAFAQIGDECVVKTTGVVGRCRISSNCPVVQEQAQNGISPTICGYYQLTVPIVCCEINTFAEPNDDTFLNRKPNRPDSSFENREPNNNPDAFVYPDHNNEPARPVVSQYLSKSEQKCQEYSKAVTGVVQAIPLVTNTEAISINIVKCDYNGVALIVGGKPASAGEFPFMAAIGFYVDNKVEWRCGGTLISEEYVLTAAHCTFTRDGDTPKVVRLGDLDLTRDDDGSIYADYNIRNIIVHPRYRYPQKYNDIALIQLSTVVKFTKFIRPACLYTKLQVEQPQAIATGWGKTDYAAAEISDKLMKVSLNIYKNERCSQTYQINKHLPQGIKSSMMCAGEVRGGMDTCQGDSGGPLLITKKGNQCKFYVIGITSFGKSCGQANTPAIYTKVSEFVPWIEKTIW
jgi:V8-like Glu-specific endopeptidase